MYDRENEQRTALVHIGLPKTGTTTLQAFFHANREKLLRKGVLYPQTGKLWHAHHNLAGLFQSPNRRLYWLETDAKISYLDFLKEEVRQQSPQKLILSSEAFSYIDKHMELKDFLLQAGFPNIKVVCFLRRQDFWAESAFTQLYKAGLVGFDFATYAYNNKRLDYLAILEDWACEFGAENILVRVIDKQTGVGNVLDAVKEVFGVGNIWRYRVKRQLNPSLNAEALHYSHLVHSEDNSKLLGWLISLLEEFSSQHLKKKYVFMRDDERLRFLQKYNATNTELAQKYLGRAMLFSDFARSPLSTYLCPPIDEVDLTEVSEFVLSESLSRSLASPNSEWADYAELISKQNERIRLL